MNAVPFPTPRFDLRLVPAPPPPRRRLAVRINVLDGRSAFGRSRVFRIAESDFDQLINAATRLEARGKKS